MSRTATAPASPASPEPPAEDARGRLLQAGLRLFAQQGYASTSTRELAEAAAVNVASISYYFGDKAGLYRAVFLEPMGSAGDDAAALSDPSLSLSQALRAFYAAFVEPLRRGDQVRLCVKLHFREMLEPTGLWTDETAHGIRPMHEALVDLLRRHCGLSATDADLQRLAIALTGLGVHLHVGHDFNEQLAPGLLDGDAPLEQWLDRLVMYGTAMVHAECARRAAAEPADPSKNP